MDTFQLYAVCGVSGSGKSALLRFVDSVDGVSIHKKDTTRAPRKNESPKGEFELNFVSELNKNEYELIYKQYGKLYGIRKDVIESAKKRGEKHFIIIGSINALKAFKKKFPKTQTIYVYCDPEHIPERWLKRDGLIPVERKKRLKRQFLEFVENSTLFDHVVVNF